jgi:hypothetical protein
MRIGDLEIVDVRELIGPHGDPQMHMWVREIDEAPPRRPVRDGHRGRDVGNIQDPFPDADAAAGAGGELRPGTVPPGGPNDPPLHGEDGEDPPTAGGVQPVYVDARSLRLRGRDQNGKNFEAHLYGPGHPPEGSDPTWPGAKPDALMTVNDHLPQALGQYQRMLNRHYAK